MRAELDAIAYRKPWVRGGGCIVLSMADRDSLVSELRAARAVVEAARVSHHRARSDDTGEWPYVKATPDGEWCSHGYARLEADYCAILRALAAYDAEYGNAA